MLDITQGRFESWDLKFMNSKFVMEFIARRRLVVELGWRQKVHSKSQITSSKNYTTYKCYIILYVFIADESHWLLVVFNFLYFESHSVIELTLVTGFEIKYLWYLVSSLT